MQEDKEAVFDALDTVSLCLEVFTEMLKSAKPLPENMLAAANKGFINATDCADYLVNKGIAFRDAHEIVGKLVKYCVDNDTVLEQLTLDEFRTESLEFDPDVYDAIALTACVERRRSQGGPASEQVKLQIESVLRFVSASTANGK
jgi:argininosuccinate lyase